MKKLILNRGRSSFVRFLALFGICAGAAFSSTGVFAQTTDPSPYCQPFHDNMGNNGCQGNYGFNFTKIELNGVTQNYSCNGSTIYRYYNSSNFTTLKRGVTYTLKLTTQSTQYQTGSAAWIDYDKNSSFNATTEFLGSQLGSNAPTLSYTFTVPATATPGKTRLRVRCDYTATLQAGMSCSNPSNYYGETIDLDIEIEASNYPDMAVTSLVKPANVCGTNPDSVVVNLFNLGNADLSNFPVTCVVTGTMNGNPVNETYNSTVTATVATLTQYRFAFPNTINTNRAGNLSFKVYTGEATDGDRSNDTVTFNMIFYGTPSNPTVSNVERCGVGTVTLASTPASGLDNIRWYSAATGGSTLGAGGTITSPFYYNSTTVYAQASRNGASGSFAPSTSGPNVYWGGTANEQGGMMNVTPTKTMTINNIYIRKFYGNTANYKVYIRQGGYNGFETNQAAWTLAGSRNGVTGGSATMIPINIGGFILEAGVTYGIYVQCLGDDFYLRYNPAPPFNESNADMLISNGNYLYGNFSNVVFNYCIDVRFDYTTMCQGNRVPVNVTVKPVPKATTLLKGSTFNGAFNSGTIADPDITASGDVIQYILDAPDGYLNSGHGTTWSVSALTIRSAGGSNLPPASYTWTAPSGAGDGVLSINPPVSYIDSLMTVTVTVNAQGCDTIFSRSVFFAPRPVANFNAASVCEGAEMTFSNVTTLTSGSISYKWYFGDGDSSVLINPSHAYAADGSYNVQLVAVSNYGYTSTITKTVQVKENPTAEFGYTNTCQGAAVPFVDASIIPSGTPTYEWNFGDNTALGTGGTTSHQYSATGVYLVTMKVTANGCSDVAQNYVTYAPRAVPNFTIQGGGCNSETVGFTNTSTLSSGQMGYSWAFGDNTTSTQTNPTHDYTAFGNINVTLTVTTDLGCVNQVTKQVSLIESPQASFTSGLLCDNKDVSFTNTTVTPGSANTNYVWTFSDGASFTTPNVTKTFPGVGTFMVTLTATSDNGCADVFTKSIVLEETPSVQFYAADVCEGDEVEFQNATVGNNNNLNYSWNFGASGTSTDKNPSKLLPLGPTSVTLTATTPAGGCQASVTKTVNVKAVPSLSNLSVVTGTLGNGTMVLSANATPNGTGYAIFWGDGGREFGTVSGGAINSLYTYVIDGRYDVEVKLDNNGCMSSGTTTADITRTSLLNVSEGTLNVYPNPTSGIVNLDLSGLNTEGVQIEVYSANGQKINGNTEINGNAVQLDLGTAAPGVYLVKVTTASGVHTARVTVNN